MGSQWPRTCRATRGRKATWFADPRQGLELINLTIDCILIWLSREEFYKLLYFWRFFFHIVAFRNHALGMIVKSAETNTNTSRMAEFLIALLLFLFFIVLTAALTGDGFAIGAMVLAMVYMGDHGK